MTDRLDDLLFSIGEEQNGRVDFDQMYADLLQKQKEEEKKRSTRRSRFVRYSAMAACAVALVGIGAAMINSSRFKAEAPAEAAMTEECVEESAPAAEGAAQEAPMMAAAQETEAPVATESAPKDEAADRGSKSKDTAAGGAGVEIGTCDDAWSRLKAVGIEAEPYDGEDAPEAGYALMTGEGEAIWNAGSGVYRVTLNGDIAAQLKELCE
ncbi:MAG: hypothetical protein SPL16_06525 [Eubacteriales bacterium]|nr:hypothetical protein [Clostridiales bacterium]MDY5710361.1 hypothetical protein [Eubacteriales bacterium]